MNIFWKKYSPCFFDLTRRALKSTRHDSKSPLLLQRAFWFSAGGGNRIRTGE
jgi:hypothetical protein